MALWPSIMACSQCSDITVPLNRRYRPLVWLARVIRGREPDSTQIASTQDGGRAEINQRDGSGLGRTTKTEEVWGGLDSGQGRRKKKRERV